MKNKIVLLCIISLLGKSAHGMLLSKVLRPRIVAMRQFSSKANSTEEESNQVKCLNCQLLKKILAHKKMKIQGTSTATRETFAWYGNPTVLEWKHDYTVSFEDAEKKD